MLLLRSEDLDLSYRTDSARDWSWPGRAVGFLDDSSGPDLLPPIPEEEHASSEFGEVGVDWNKEGDTPLFRTARLRYQTPSRLFSYLMGISRWSEDDFWSRSGLDAFSVPRDDTQREIHRRSVYWTLTFFTIAHELLNQTVVPPGYPVTVSVGYFDPNSEADAFGIAIAIDSDDSPFLDLPTTPVPLYLLPAVRERQVRLPSILGWQDDVGPLIVRRPRPQIELHGPPGIAGASSAAYVRDMKTGTPMGLLGCRHVLPTPTVGSTVPMVGYPKQTVVAESEKLDLAVVSSPTPVPIGLRPVHRWPAQWQPCTIDGDSGPVQTRVADVSNTWGVFSDPLLPAALGLEDPGQHGDSGAAVLDKSSDPSDGVCGVYRGAIYSQGPARGYAVHIQQVEQVMRLELVQ